MCGSEGERGVRDVRVRGGVEGEMCGSEGERGCVEGERGCEGDVWE